MYFMRQWSVRHARLLERMYQMLENVLIKSTPLLNKLGHDRLEKPVAAVEKVVKGALFDCQMCGQCVLSSTGMSCPMNCPKSIRNGPCGGVRTDGFCEVKPQMRCVWVNAWDGSKRMKHDQSISTVQFAVDHRLIGRSSWLHVVRQKNPSINASARTSSNKNTS
ncbi:MAG: methylenetetrahydrofolate reductase C-terminal domain-containing protein [Granulosicoccus sp.]|nr:methylenetetrahydrofolate reductase C-terminal domain-containing protein [Granulosicoccus sp.]